MFMSFWTILNIEFQSEPHDKIVSTTYARPDNMFLAKKEKTRKKIEKLIYCRQMSFDDIRAQSCVSIDIKAKTITK